MGTKDFRASVRGGDQRIGFVTASKSVGHVVDDALPLALRNLRGRADVGDETDMLLGTRDVKENAAAVRSVRNAAHDELRQSRAMDGLAAQSGRRQTGPHSGRRKQQRNGEHERERGLEEKNLLRRHQGKEQERPRREQSDDRRQSGPQAEIGVGSGRHDAKDRRVRDRLNGRESGLDFDLVLRRPEHHQLPEAPPPLNEPPPPENPPPPPPPDQPPPPPDQPPRDPDGMKTTLGP